MTDMSRTVLPLLALVALVSVAGLVFLLDWRSKRMRRRIETLTAGVTRRADATAQSVSIIRQSRGENRKRALDLLFKMPNRIPPSFPLPSTLTFGVGGVLGIGAGLLSTAYLPPLYAAGMAVLGAWLAVRGLFGWQRRGYSNKLLMQMPDTIELMVSAVRAGLPISEAVRSVAREMPQPTSDEFVLLSNEVALGVSPDVAMRALHLRTGLAEYGIFSVTLAVQSRSGGRLAETIQNLAETTRQRVALAGKARALAAEAKFSAIALTVLPLLGGVGMAFVQPGYIDMLLFDPGGRHLLMVAGITLSVGVLVMRWMIQQAVAP